MLITWNGSINIREDMTMVKGGQYETKDLKPPIGEETLREWIAVGVAIPVEDADVPEAEAEVVDVPKVDDAPVKDDSIIEELGDSVKIKRLEDEEAPEPADIEIPEPEPEPEPEEIKFLVASKSYSCPEPECEKGDEPYKTTGGFISHMKKKHGQAWGIDGEYLVKKG